MTTVDRAAEIIERATRGAHTADGHLMKMSDHTAQIIAEALADAGLLAPEPRIVRTRDELATLDPDTLVTDRIPAHDAWPGCQVLAFPAPAAHRLDLTWNGPMIVIAYGDQARAARQALREAVDAVD